MFRLSQKQKIKNNVVKIVYEEGWFSAFHGEEHIGDSKTQNGLISKINLYLANSSPIENLEFETPEEWIN